MKPKFSSGDKVFAKVRGYPPWPARVEGLADETPHKMKYHIYFYGTGETAVVKAEDICSFVENKVRLGKPKKPKNFTEALIQIEAELSDAELDKLADLQKQADETSSKDQSGNISINDSITDDSAKKSGGGKSKISVSPTPKPKKSMDKKRKLDDSGAEDSEKKRPVLSTSDAENSDSGKVAEVMSRSGRKIKPKRFADFEEGSSDEQPSSIQSPKPVGRAAPITKKLLHLESEDILQTDEHLVFSVNKEQIKLPLNLNRPRFSDASQADQWKLKVLDFASGLRKAIESGELNVDTALAKMDDYTKEESGKVSSKFIPINDHLKAEANLLEIDLGIRSALSIKNPDVERCLLLLDQLNAVELKAIMLKKHPDVVTTIKKVRRYIGNCPKSYSEVEEKRFHKTAEIIRSKAETIYNKFQSLFLVPPSKSFWDFFEEERENFYLSTKHMASDDIVALIEEPGCESHVST